MMSILKGWLQDGSPTNQSLAAQAGINKEKVEGLNHHCCHPLLAFQVPFGGLAASTELKMGRKELGIVPRPF